MLLLPLMVWSVSLLLLLLLLVLLCQVRSRGLLADGGERRLGAEGAEGLRAA
jgi:hypothetical protein